MTTIQINHQCLFPNCVTRKPLNHPKILHTGYDNYIVIQAAVYLVVRHKCAFVSTALEKNSLVFTKLAVPAKLSNVLQKEREKG
ncbi:hypothetical protein TNIN_432681 [Trichonephila inaurata madagascariensis]|uniref:Uncharacterized protein n=1 Tax=Trichonephila inaurata madagascariensis TaxID=2747483 RepID=A0A8X6IE89_9ARAC|nr:hypothetical protein TNIN_432681 [Trichonephila inaurata madagascariensis]